MIIIVIIIINITIITMQFSFAKLQFAGYGRLHEKRGNHLYYYSVSFARVTKYL